MFMWASLFRLFLEVSFHHDTIEEVLEVMAHKVNNIIERHNKAVNTAKELDISYKSALNTYEPYMSSYEIDILSGFNPSLTYETVERAHFVPLVKVMEH